MFVRDGVMSQCLRAENVGELPDVFEVSRLNHDEVLRKQADSLIGAVALNQSVRVDKVDEPLVKQPDVSNNLAESIGLAQEGDPKAIKLLKINARTDYIERAFKSGFVMAVDLERNEDGKLTQNGQTLESVQVNSLRYLENERLKERAKVEALHTIRDQYYADKGVFKKYARVTLSLVDDQMSDEEAAKAGFFVNTRSLSIQLVTEDEKGDVVIQSAFVAGKQSADAAPFDIRSAREFAERLGVDYEGLGSEEMHARPILVDKSIMPDVLVAAQLFDESASEITGSYKFFGKNRNSPPTRADYIQRYDENKKMVDDMDHDIDIVAWELMCSSPQSPLEATTELARLNDKLLKDRIITDESIDANVLGVEAAYRVNHARDRYRELQSMPIEMQQQNQIMRDIDMLQKEINDLGSSSSCPGGATNKKMDSIFGELEGQDKNEDSKETVEDCEFISEECPECGDTKVKTTAKNGKYYGDCGCESK